MVCEVGADCVNNMARSIATRWTFWLLPVGSAALLSFSYLAAPAPALVFVALVPLFLFLDRATARQSFWGGWLFGFLFIGWELRWIFDVLMLDWAGISNPFVGLALGAAFWLVGTLALSLFFGAFGRAYRFFSFRQRILCIPLAWIVLEYARSFALGIVLAGSETLLGSHWTFGALGYAFSEFPALLPSTKLLGLYGASFVVVLCNVVAARALSDPVRRAREGVTAALALVTLAWYGLYVLSTPSVPASSVAVALIQTSARLTVVSTPDDTREILKSDATLLEQAARSSADLVVIPETSPIIAVQRNPLLYLQGVFGADSSKTVLFSKKSNSGRSFLDIFWYRPDKGVLAKTQKTLLIPGGEYIPFLFETPLRLFGFGDFVDDFNATFTVFKGKDSFATEYGGAVPKEGVLLCSAVFAPDLWRGLALRGAEVFINPANQSFFSSTSFHRQNKRALQFFSATHDRWFLQASNGGFAYVIDDNGSIAKELPIGSGVLEYRAEYRTTRTLATRLGNWPLVAAFAVLAYCARERRRDIL